MGQQIQKVCQHKLGENWKDGCCTDNPPVDNIFIESKSKLSVVSGREGIASAVEQYRIVPTKSQQDLYPHTTDSNS
jgi:hypothetical protein